LSIESHPIPVEYVENDFSRDVGMFRRTRRRRSCSWKFSSILQSRSRRGLVKYHSIFLTVFVVSKFFDRLLLPEAV